MENDSWAMSNNDVNYKIIQEISTTWEYYLFSFLSQYLSLCLLHFPLLHTTAAMDSNNVKEDIDRLVKGFTSLDS